MGETPSDELNVMCNNRFHVVEEDIFANDGYLNCYSEKISKINSKK